MRYVSVCSGIEAATAAGHSLGWTPVAFAEIEKFPSAVLAHHYPDVPNLGDFTKIEASDVGPIDLLVGGTPCQSFSVAGKRLGLDDPRGNLALEFCRLARRLRPRWIVWENVPGVHSSWSGAPDSEALGGDGWVGDEDSDFGAFLDALEECGYSACWRVLDAQFVRVESHPHAVPQRRERVFVVGYLGDWRPPAAVLLEPEGMRRDSPPRREARQAVAGSLGAGSARSGQRVGRREAAANHLVAGTVTGRTGNGSRQAGANSNVVAATLEATASRSRGAGTPVGHIIAALAFGGNNTEGPIEVATARNGHAVPHGRCDFETETFVVPIDMPPSIAGRQDHEQARKRKRWRGHGIGESGDPAFTVSERGQAIAVDITNQSVGGEVAGTLEHAQHKSNRGQGVLGFHSRQDPCCDGDVAYAHDAMHPPANGVLQGVAVRRLTPTECELLQGFTPGFTAITYRGKPAADGPRYKALGNSMAVNVMAWIGARIDAFEAVKRALNLDDRSEAA